MACGSVEDRIFDEPGGGPPEDSGGAPEDSEPPEESEPPVDSEPSAADSGDSALETGETGDTACEPSGEEIVYSGVGEDCDPGTPDDDLDGGGHQDLLVGSLEGPDPSGVETGVVYLVAGSGITTGDVAELAFATIAGGAAGDQLGTAGCGLQDLGGDGDAELALLSAVPWHPSGGRVVVQDGAGFEGWASGELGTGAALWVSSHEADALGTSALVLDQDGLGGADLLVGAPEADGGAGGVFGSLR